MNIPLLKKVRAAILKHPSQFNMDWWFQRSSSTGNKPKGCGTAACIAGWTVLIARKFSKLTTAEKRYGISAEISAEIAARDILGISDLQARRLFGVRGWPTRLDKAYYNAKTDKQAAEIAAKRIDLFIKTKGAK